MKPVIDIHEHIFRGRDIPLKGYLYSRKYTGFLNFVARFLRLLSAIARCIRRTQKNGKRGLLCRVLIWLACRFLGSGYRIWADILSLPDISDVMDELDKTCKADKVDLYVPLMIDYEYWFKNTVDEPIDHQIDEIYRSIVLERKGKVHPFVAFDPARELAYRKRMPGPEGSREKYSSLEMVKDAIENKGFIGVKLYPAIGYRPAGNSAVDKQRRKLFRKIKMERYSVFTGDEIDGVLDDLYRYCVKEQVPITTHCVSGGIEAYPDASYDFGSPVFWQPVLRKYPSLHVNLAHFGWTGKERYIKPDHDGNKPWVKEICDMITMHRYLYTDAAHHGVTDPKPRKEFLNDYPIMFADHGEVIKKKLMYGIDWHVFSKEKNYTQFKPEYIRLWKELGLYSDDELGLFLGGNAMEFL